MVKVINIRFVFATLVVSLVFSACQGTGLLETDPIDPNDYTLETVLPEDGGVECVLKKVSTGEEITSFINEHITQEKACRFIGFWDRTFFAQVTPSDFGYTGFYSPYFAFYGLDVDTGEVEDLGFFIAWTDDAGNEHEGAFSSDFGSNALGVYNFVTDKKITFTIADTFEALGSPFLNSDGSLVIFSAVVVGDLPLEEEWPTIFSTSILVGDMDTGLVEEIYSYDDWLDLKGWSGKEIEFSEEGKSCSLSKDGTNKQCQPLNK